MPDPYAEALRDHFMDAGYEWTKRIPGESDYEWPEDAHVVWQADGTALVEGTRSRKTLGGPYRVTVLVEPTKAWRQVTWYDVALITPENSRSEDTRPLVSLQGVEAVVLSAVAQRWHVRPGTGTAAWNPPSPLEHDIVMVKLQVAGKEPAVYQMPPDGQVMLLAGGPVGPAVAALAAQFEGMEVVQDGQ